MADEFNPLAALLSGQQARTQFDINAQQQQAIQLQNQLAEQAGQGGFNPLFSQQFAQLGALDPGLSSNIVSNFLNLSDERKGAFFKDAQKANKLLDQNRVQDIIQLGQNRRRDLLNLDPNADTSDTDLVIGFAQQGLQTGDFSQLRGSLEQAIDLGIDQGFLKDPLGSKIKISSEQTFFNELTKDLSSNRKRLAADIRLGLKARAGTSAQERLGQDVGLTEGVALSQASIAAAKETAKLTSQLKLKPRIQKAVALATAEANLIADNKSLANSNEKALKVYNVGMKSLATSLEATETGIIVGSILPLTVKAQSAEGAIAIMAPLLKKMFRTAGEGIFTDKDQELLMKMIPTRSDKPGAIKFKLRALDAIIRVKLGGAVEQTQLPTAQTEFGITPEEQAELDALEAEFGGR